MSAPIVFLDIETTGLHHDRRPWEIGMIRREPDGGQRELTLYISDVDLAHAELIGLNIGRFYERYPMYWTEVGGAFTMDTGIDDDTIVDPDYADQRLKFDEALHPEKRAAVIVERWTRGAHIVGSVPNFDTETLAAMLRRHGLCPSWHYHLIDVEVLAIGHLGAVRRLNPYPIEAADVAAAEFDLTALPWKSDDLSRAVGVEPPGPDERHTAMGDARWAMRMYDRINGGAQ
ncbi:hypothetical protein B7C42_01607 [Nocardia cerradoensis]|uniref:Exonuclease domain-containing protein n=1 Tax=Nocardia cerradoensis TaxID=85688 RepID=A0A231HCF4_9NOCA|nr:hypothetical protein [Nocardia cerradoensis]OXR46633.1 hypothetical protein B7C42_01607 [Nocardia cerradoensis]